MLGQKFLQRVEEKQSLIKSTRKSRELQTLAEKKSADAVCKMLYMLGIDFYPVKDLEREGTMFGKKEIVYRATVGGWNIAFTREKDEQTDYVVNTYHKSVEGIKTIYGFTVRFINLSYVESEMKAEAIMSHFDQNFIVKETMPDKSVVEKELSMYISLSSTSDKLPIIDDTQFTQLSRAMLRVQESIDTYVQACEEWIQDMCNEYHIAVEKADYGDAENFYWRVITNEVEIVNA